MGIALQRLFRYHEDPAFLELQQARSCSSSFSSSKNHYLLHSSSTEKPLPPMYSVRYSKDYADLSRTKDRSCSLKMWFCSMITHLHVSSVTRVKWAKFKWDLPDHLIKRNTLQPGHVALWFSCVWSPEKTSEKAALQLGRWNQGHCEGLGLVHDYRNSGRMESFGPLINGILVLRPMVYTLNKIFFLYPQCRFISFHLNAPCL